MRAILGGGIAGLSAAHYLVQRFPGEKITLFESSNRTGGWIKSNILPNNILFEEGPRTIRPRGKAAQNTLDLINELNLFPKLLSINTSHPATRNRMIFAKGKLHILPSSLIDVLHTISPFQKPLFLYLARDIYTKPQLAKNNDESIYNFVERRFGKDIAEYAISPLICGICAGDAKEISVKLIMESLFEKEQKYGSITRGMLTDFLNPKNEKVKTKFMHTSKNWSVYSFENGLETLPKTLSDSIKAKGIDVTFNKKCTEIQFNGNTAILYFEDGNNTITQVFNHVISSVPAFCLAQLINKQHPLLANYLNQIPFVTVAVVNLHFDKKLNIENAFGLLVPPSENLPILGITFDSCIFPCENNTILTVMMGGKWFNQYFGENPKESVLIKTALENTNNILNLRDVPNNIKLNVLKDCIPQYIVGHSETIKNIENYIEMHNLPISVCGSSYYGIGINDVILSAKSAVVSIKTK